ncbi:chemotaxis protein CheC [Patescibacteria group bacterium]|nr:chemotaxis protein CheC [Patescibacteria group bacterium]
MAYLSEEEKDQLIEVINIGVGNASTALSQMVNEQVTLSVPEMYAGPVENALDFIGESEQVQTAVLFTVSGDIDGMMFLIFSSEDALKLVQLVSKQYNQEKSITKGSNESALKEIGNVLLGPALGALSHFLDAHIVQSVPELASDMLDSVIDEALSEVLKSSKAAMIFKTEFSVKSKDISGHFFFLFEPKATDEILKMIKEKYTTS